MAEMSIDQAISRYLPTLAKPRHRDAAIIDQPCPKCGSRVLCLYDDPGATDFYDNFAHICLNPECDHFLHHEGFECNMGGRGSSSDQGCIFCHRKLAMTC